MIEQAIYALLAADAAVGGIAGDRISPHARLQGTQLPAVTYELTDLEPFVALSGTAGLTAATLQVTSVAHTYATARDLASSVVSALNGYTGTTAGAVISSCHYTTQNSVDTGVGEGEEDLPFEFITNFRIHFEGL